MNTNNNKIKVGDAFFVKGGANEHGRGTQVALVRKVTEQGKVFCVKFSQKTKNVVAKNYRLKSEDIINDLYTDRLPFMSWFWHQCTPSQQDNIVAFLESEDINNY